jgi:hypothetical protein
MSQDFNNDTDFPTSIFENNPNGLLRDTSIKLAERIRSSLLRNHEHKAMETAGPNLQLLQLEVPDPAQELSFQVCNEFHLFPMLPMELRLMIWRATLPPPRRIWFWSGLHGKAIRQKKNPAKPPASVQANREARTELSPFYHIWHTSGAQFWYRDSDIALFHDRLDGRSPCYCPVCFVSLNQDLNIKYGLSLSYKNIGAVELHLGLSDPMELHRPFPIGTTCAWELDLFESVEIFTIVIILLSEDVSKEELDEYTINIEAGITHNFDIQKKERPGWSAPRLHVVSQIRQGIHL